MNESFWKDGRLSLPSLKDGPEGQSLDTDVHWQGLTFIWRRHLGEGWLRHWEAESSCSCLERFSCYPKPTKAHEAKASPLSKETLSMSFIHSSLAISCSFKMPFNSVVFQTPSIFIDRFSVLFCSGSFNTTVTFSYYGITEHLSRLSHTWLCSSLSEEAVTAS